MRGAWHQSETHIGKEERLIQKKNAIRVFFVVLNLDKHRINAIVESHCGNIGLDGNEQGERWKCTLEIIS